MTPFIVRVRIPDLGPSPTGTIALYVVLCETEGDALFAVSAAIPDYWRVEDVVGRASEELVQRRNLKDGIAEMLA